MLKVYPDYYKDFSCVAEKCRHNCCIGWEIDIDEKTKKIYDTTEGEMGKRLCENISKGDTAHFILGKGERCPFLNDRNLCDIILELGEESICDICREHPRFTNELPGRLETGLGLTCEEAARIVIGKKEPMMLEMSGDETEADELLSLRDEIVAVLQNREKRVSARINEALALCGINSFEVDILEWIDFFLSLECMDKKWQTKIKELSSLDLPAFCEHMKLRESEYEQFVVYLVYRYFANAFDVSDAAVRMCFVKLCFELLYNLGGREFLRNGDFTFEDQVELARMFSSEIEYSEDNMDRIFEEISYLI